MTDINKDKIIEVLEMIKKDMKNDAEHFDGKPFTRRTVAEYFGRQGAAIAALANMIKSILERGGMGIMDTYIKRLQGTE